MKTNKIKQIITLPYVKYGIFILVGVLLGWLLFSNSKQTEKASASQTEKKEEAKEIWTCSMHPQIRQDHPGKCPICGMDLTPLKTSSDMSGTADPNGIQMSEEAIALANIQTSTVGTGNTGKSLLLYGTIQPDERTSQTQSAYVGGRIERLFVNFIGESIRKGQTIATIYSPELVNAQQELLEAQKLSESQPYLLQAAREKLRLLNISEEQIHRIEQSRKVSAVIEIKSNTNGILVEKNANPGDYVNQGTPMFKVANLSQVWALFEAYESDLPFLKVGQTLTFTLNAVPGKTFSGRISFIDPMVDKDTRTAKVRVIIANPGMVLKPGMYAQASLRAAMNQYQDRIVVPKTAVLWTGKRSIVYIKQQGTSSPVFIMREIVLGPSLGNAYVVMEGLESGEEIVTNGVFAVDASAQLEGKPSMMNRPEQEEHHPETSPEKPVSMNYTMKVDGRCDMCKENIEKAARSVQGVSGATWDKNKKILHLTYSGKEAIPDIVGKAIAHAGYDNEKYKAGDQAYEGLPACCKYRE